MANDKYLIREKYKYIRNQMSPKDVTLCSTVIFKNIMNHDAYKLASCVFVYMSMFHEVDTYDFIVESLALGKTIAIPRIENKTMDFYKIEDIEDVKQGYFGILEPVSNHILTPRDNDLMIIPGLAFDIQGYRVGYGGGYYDTYISTHQGIQYVKAGVAYEVQVTSEVPRKSYDQPIDLLFTEALDYKFTKL
ncbi:MAG: 5-formyltetrahydrofolate cyclo-ligase [Vallitaleaceae bacterium]|jgi:5-formyltetrahydrofolate cyclo-ligase|nr:5-formyltetrahydrofolate cyclo-ligase [Vallitaleaceae bacterium]